MQVRLRSYLPFYAISLFATLYMFSHLSAPSHLAAAPLGEPTALPAIPPQLKSQHFVNQLYLPLVRREGFSPPQANPSTPTLLATNTPGGTAGTPTPPPTVQPTAQARIIGYFVSWGVYARNFHVADIGADKLTHINYAFANISEEGDCVLGDPFADTEKLYPKTDHENDPPGTLRGSFNQLRLLKEAHPHLKTLISVGGWLWSTHFSDVALTAESRARFARSCIDFMTRYGFDGIDIDWEYPTGGGRPENGARPADKENFTLLLAELRRALDAQKSVDGRDYLLTIAAPAGPALYANIELAQIHPYLDWINVMTYDFHGGEGQMTHFNAPLFAATDDPTADGARLNTDAALRAYTDAGVPADKVVMGIPFYGRGWSGVDHANGGLFQPSSGLPQGTWEPGVFDYADLVANYMDAGYDRHWHPTAHVPWLYSAESQIMISYDDAESVGQKADHIRANGLGGAMIWELSADTSGNVAGAEGRNLASLLDTLYTQLNRPLTATQTPPPPTPTALGTATAPSNDLPTSTQTALATALSTPTFAPPNTPPNTPVNAPTSTLAAETPAPPTSTNGAPATVTSTTAAATSAPATSTPSTPAPTATSTPTNAPPATPVDTATNTPVNAPINTATNTATNTPPPTHTPTHTATSTPTHTPTPLPIPAIDLSINGLEVTQAIQDGTNSVPLVANRPVQVRVFAQVVGGAATGVQVQATGHQNGQLLGNITSIPSAISTAPLRGAADSTINLPLPLAWTTGVVELTVTVDSANAIAESNEANNGYKMTLTFNQVPTFNIVLVPINYTHNGTLYPAPTEDTVSSSTLELYPLSALNVTLHAAHDFAGNLEQEADWRRLAIEIDGIKAADGAPSSTYYYGVVPIENADGRWFSSGVAGISAVGARFGVGLDGNALTAAHEFGHGFGLSHAPCGVNGSSDYPYTNASIGQYGFDQAGQVKDPAQYKDIMSYCAPKWVSDYTYKIVYADQQANGQTLAAAAEDVLLIRAVLTNGVPSIAPIYTLWTAPTQLADAGEYTLQMMGTDGQLMAQYPARAVALETLPLGGAAELTESSTLIMAAVPAPALPVASLRILHNNGLLATQTLVDRSNWINQQQLTVTKVGEELAIAWTFANTPTTVRFSADNGASWHTLAMDNTRGSLSIDPKLLPQDGRGLYQIIPGNSTTSVLFQTEYP